MKTYLVIIAALLSLSTWAADTSNRLSIFLYYTNQPSAGDSYTYNGSTRTFKTLATNSSSQITIGATIGATASNSYSQAVSAPFSGPVFLSMPATNRLNIQAPIGASVAFSISGTWGYYTIDTQVVANMITMRAPVTGEQNTTVRTNVGTAIADALSLFSTNAIATDAVAMGNFVSTTGTQTVSNKTVTLSVVDASDITNSIVKTLIVPYVTTAESGIEFQGPGGFRVATIAPDANGIPSLYGTEHNPIPTNTFGAYTPNGENLLIRAAGDTYYGRLTAANSWPGTNEFTRITNSTMVGSVLTDNTYSGTIGTISSGTISGSTVTNTTYYGTVGLLSGGYLSGVGGTNVTLTNSFTKMSFDIVGDIAFRRYDHTSLASSNNANINFGTNVYVKIVSGPTATFNLSGIANGRDGKEYLIYNDTAYQMVVQNESGADSTVERRIRTVSGTDKVIGSGYWVHMIYDSGISRWKLINQPFYAADLPSGINATNIANGTVSNADFEYIAGIASLGLPAAGLGTPTATIGLTAIPGTATTATRSDGAPALSQDIAPVWTQQHKFRGTGTRISVQYDVSNKTDFETGTTGELIVNPSGLESNFAGIVDASTGFKVGGFAPLGYAFFGDGNKYVGRLMTAADLAFSINATNIGAGAVSSTEYGYLDGVTSAIQTQLDAKSTGSGTDGVYTKWTGTTALGESVIQEGGFYVVPRTNNVVFLGSSTNRWNTIYGGVGAFSGVVIGTQIISTVSSGTPPLSVASVTDVANLSVNYLQGKDAAFFWPCFGSTGAGEMSYAAATTGNPTRLPANTTTTPKYLRMVGDGVNSAAPTWSQPSIGELSGSVSISSGGTGTGTTFTQGSVVFAGASGVYSQDVTNLFWDTSMRKLLIGGGLLYTNDATVSPSIELLGANPGFIFSRSSDDAGGSNIRIMKSRGTPGFPTSVTNQDSLGSYTWRAFDGSSYLSPVFIQGKINGTVSAGSTPADIIFATGSTGGPTEKMRITSGGVVAIGTGTNFLGGALEVRSITEQVRMDYDSTHYASHTVNSSGFYSIAPSGGYMTLPSTTLIVGSSTAGAEKLTVQAGNILLDNQYGIKAKSNTGVVTPIFSISAGNNVQFSTPLEGGALQFSCASNNISFYTGLGATNQFSIANNGAVSVANTLTVAKVLASTPSALTYASPTSVDVTLGNVFTVTTVNATGSVTFNATAGGTAGQRVVVIVTNDATSAKTITFGTNFVPNGTLTPSGASKVATIEFLSNGTSFYEVARTVLP